MIPEVPRLHPRNRHTGHYDFAALTRACPSLQPFVHTNPVGESTIDFANPAAVRWLNAALLSTYYGIHDWQIPEGYLCPPIPGRADLIHTLADLLASSHHDQIPRGPEVRVLDIGVGASAIYPIIGHCEYGWSFVGTDIDAKAIQSAARNVQSDARLAGAVELRTQTQSNRVFEGVVKPGERFDLTLCNPPFHASAEAAQYGSRRKWENLGKRPTKGAPLKNFGGQSNELWCPGGELAFVRQMIQESVGLAKQCLWFSSLISRDAHLEAVYEALERVQPADVQTLHMAQGQKKSRVVAWTFIS